MGVGALPLAPLQLLSVPLLRYDFLTPTHSFYLNACSKHKSITLKFCTHAMDFSLRKGKRCLNYGFACDPPMQNA
eukprot:3831551-Amphidinium_carterae.1